MAEKSYHTQLKEGDKIEGGPWDGFEVVSTYSDAQAVADGVLVDFPGDAGVNRATRAVFDHFTRTIGGVMTDITPLQEAIRAVLAGGKKDVDWLIGEYDGKRLWIIPNETTRPSGGTHYTIMFPEDY